MDYQIKEATYPIDAISSQGLFQKVRACVRFFRKKGKNGKTIENLGKNVKTLKIIEKGRVTACDNRTQQTARKDPAWLLLHD